MSIVLQSSGGGSVTINEPTTASNYTQTLPAATGTVMVSGNQPAFSAYNTASQSVANNTNTKVLFQTEEFDTANCFDNATNYRFTPTVAGYYQINANVSWAGVTANVVLSQLYKNGSAFKAGNREQASGQYTWQVISTLVYANGTTDYFEIYAFQNSGGSVNIDYGPVNETYFQACLVRGA
jgi:hypothetical protein